MSTGGQRPGAPRLTFDTNMAGIRQTRVFWATLCELSGQPFILTETGALETLRRERLETERLWAVRLAAANRVLGAGWTATERRRLSTQAAMAARDWLREQLRTKGGAYRLDATRNATIDELQGWIDEHVDDRIFDMSTDNGIRDRKIVVEAMARGYDIIVSNNINTLSSSLLRAWVVSDAVQDMGITTAILPPQVAEEQLREAAQMPVEWCAWAAAQAAVTDPYSAGQAAEEVAALTEVFDARGMEDIATTIERVTQDPAVFDMALERVRTHGNSAAARAERAREIRELNTLAKRTGIAPADLAATFAP